MSGSREIRTEHDGDRNRRVGPTRPGVLFLYVGVVASMWGSSSAAASRAELVSVSSVPDGNHVVFVVVLARPDDMVGMSIERPVWSRSQQPWPSLPELYASPVWKAPCYLEWSLPTTESPPAWERNALPQLDRLTYVGRCAHDIESLSLTFRYHTTAGEIRDTELSLDLCSAQPLLGRPAPRKRWAAAQAAWLELLATQTSDVGGFFAFAAQRTREQYELPPPAETRPRWRWRLPPEDRMYDIMTGALAVQESLQLDRMTETDRESGLRDVPIAEIPAVHVASHPFDTMRGDETPQHSALAELVPEDFYYVRFADIGKMYKLLDFADQWGASLLRLATPAGTDYGIRRRVHRQLCLPETALTRLLGPAMISEVAVIGSDPYLREGSDVTVLFRVKGRRAFEMAVDSCFARTRQEISDAALQTVTHRGVPIERLVSPRREVSCHRCWLDDVCVYGNSLEALKRVLDVRAGERPSLAAAPGFRYMRACVFSLDPMAEDGFLYLSDPFIRRLVGPELRIKEKRRLEAVTSLKMIANAALLHGYRFGPRRPTLDELWERGCLKPSDLLDPEGGTFTWDAQAGRAHSSTYNHLGFLTPLIELDADRATQREFRAYERFRDRYQQYWRRYFDPIGVRFRVGRTIRVETCILPLIDLSEYDRFQDIAGGEPIEVRLDRFTPDTLLRIVMHLNDGVAKQQALEMLRFASGGTNVSTDWVGNRLTFWIEDTAAFKTLLEREYQHRDDPERRSVEPVDIFNASFVLGVHVRNKLSLAAFLVSLRAFIETMAPDTVVFNNLEPYRNVSIVQIAPDPASDLAGLSRTSDDGDADSASPTSAPVVSERGPALYYATIQDGFYVSTQASALRKLIDRLAEPPTASTEPETIRCNLAVYAAPGAAELARPTVRYFIEQRARETTLRNMTQVWMLGRCGVLEDLPIDDAAGRYLGYRLVCPNGGDYHFDPQTVEVVSSIYGPLSDPVRLHEPPESSPLNRLLGRLETVVAHLQFTDEGVLTTVEIRRRKHASD